MERLIAPDPRAHITRASSEVVPGRAGRDRDDRVLVTLQHELGVARSWVPELHAAVLGARKHPVSVWGEGY